MTKSKIIQKKIPTHILIKDIGIDFILLAIAGFIFALSFPNFILKHGSSGLVIFSLIPISVVIRRASFKLMPFYGFFYGNFAYILFNVWLYKFAPTAFLIVPPIYGIYFLWVFVLLKAADKYFPKCPYLFQAMVWLCYEYIKNTGFLAYAFGTLGYAWAFKPILIQSTSIFGVWGITFFIAILSFYLGYLYNECIASKKDYKMKLDTEHNPRFLFIHFMRKKRYFIPGVIFAGVFVIIVIAGQIQIKNIERAIDKSPTERIALVQHVLDPWKGKFVAFKQALELLTAQSKAVLESENPPKLVVWSETAFVPSIAYHLKYRERTSYLRLIMELLDFFSQYPETEFLIGNGEGVKIKNEKGVLERMDYNASLLFRGGERLQSYYKMNLVPFTETFPYTRLFPRLYNFLLNNDTHFWIAGKEHTVFESSGLKFSTPICFEDGFPVQNAEFVKRGANILINITNDAWSGMDINEYQHFALSIIRAVENRRTVLRGTNAGITAVVRPSGIIQNQLPPFEREILVDDVPIYKSTLSFFTKHPNWFVYLVFGFVFASILAKIIKYVRTRE